MTTRVAVMSIIVEDSQSVQALNEILHENGAYIIGRMGIPYRAKGINIISIALDADRKSTRLNSSHMSETRMPSSA